MKIKSIRDWVEIIEPAIIIRVNRIDEYRARKVCRTYWKVLFSTAAQSISAAGNNGPVLQ